MLILGIESSCDETAAAVVEDRRILSTLVASQDEVHAKYGGVVPELASRRHMECTIPLVNGALQKARVGIKDIDCIAVTYAPGLLGSLLVGIQFAKGLAFAAGKPLVGVNHLEVHLNAVSLERDDVPFPHIGLLVSGGHTSLYLVKGFGDYELLGATRDDAAGEAFDKVAKLLNLGYPGGPIIDKFSETGDAGAFRFTTPKFEHSDKFGAGNPHLDFSFSGIKTAVLLKHRDAAAKGGVSKQFVADIAASFQDAVVNFLTERAIAGVRETGAMAVVLAGGVAANRHLRRRLDMRCKEANVGCFIPSIHLCTDNAAMIAYVGGLHLKMGRTSDMGLNAVANEEIGI